MNILISNDDGVFAPGILAAKQAVEDIANVTVVAPDVNNSSVGRRLTLFKHLKITSCFVIVYWFDDTINSYGIFYCFCDFVYASIGKWSLI